MKKIVNKIIGKFKKIQPETENKSIKQCKIKFAEENDIIGFIDFISEYGRLKQVEEFCGKNIPYLIKIEDGVLHCSKGLNFLRVGDCIVRDSEGLLLHYKSETIRRYYNSSNEYDLMNNDIMQKN